METSLTLAPAAGTGIGKLIADALLADPEFIPLMKAAFIGALQAVTGYKDKKTGEWMTIDDHRTRLNAAMGIMAHMEGEPIKRIIHQHLGGAGGIDPLAALQESPELRAAVEATLAKANWRTSGQKAHKRPKKVEQAKAPTLDVG